MGSLFNMSAKYLFGLGALATAGVTNLFSWLPSPNTLFFTATDTYITTKLTNTVLAVKKYLFTRDEMQAMIETSVRKVLHEEYQNIFLSTISFLGESGFFVVNSLKELCVTNPFFVLGTSLVVYFGYKFKYLFSEYFPNVSKKIEFFFFGNSKLDSTEILEKGTLEAVNELKELTNLQSKYSREISQMFLDFYGTLTKKLEETNHLIEESNNATSQLFLTMKTIQDEAVESLKEIVTSNPTLINEQTTLLMTTLRRLEYSFLIKLKTINKTTHQMSLDIGTKVVGGNNQVGEVSYIREVHNRGSNTENVVHTEQCVATDNVNLVRQNHDIGNVRHQDHTVVTVEDVPGAQNPLANLGLDYFDSSDDDFETFAPMPHDNGMTLEKFNSIPHPYGLSFPDSSANSVVETFDWSLMYSIENLSMLIIFFGLLFYYFMKKKKFYGIY